MGFRRPGTVGGTTISIVLCVEDVDAVFNRAIKGGARSQRPVVDQFYGDRLGTVEDSFGHAWTAGAHVEGVSPQEMRKRMAAADG